MAEVQELQRFLSCQCIILDFEKTWTTKRDSVSTQSLGHDLSLAIFIALRNALNPARKEDFQV